MAVVYDEKREWSAGRDGIQVVRTLRVTPYNEVSYVADLLLGGVRLIGGFLFRVPPARDPFFNACICTKVEADEGIGAWTGTAASGINNLIIKSSYAEGCRIRVTYETLDSTLDPRDGDWADPPAPGQLPSGGGHDPTNQQEIDLASETWDYAAQQLTYDAKHLVTKSEASSEPRELANNLFPFVTTTVPQVTLTLTRKYCIRPPFQAIRYLVGTVNKSEFGKTSRKFPIETIRFDGLHAARQITSFGYRMFELQYKFAMMTLVGTVENGGITDVGWLRKYDPRDGRWYLVSSVNNLNKYLYDYDEDLRSQTINGSAVRGFNLLFHPRAT